MPHRQTLAESRFDTTPPSTINGAIRLPGQHVPTSQYLSTEPAHIREQPLTNPYGRPSAAVSSTAGFVQTKAQQTECPQPPSEAREIGQFFVHSTEYPRGHRFFTPKPEEISFLPPLAIKRPDLAETRQLSLQRVPPCILFVQFPCKQRCRSLGICIHYQFVVPCGKCPDGLICPACMRNNTQQVIAASSPFSKTQKNANLASSVTDSFANCAGHFSEPQVSFASKPRPAQPYQQSSGGFSGDGPAEGTM